MKEVNPKEQLIDAAIEFTCCEDRIDDGDKVTIHISWIHRHISYEDYKAGKEVDIEKIPCLRLTMEDKNDCNTAEFFIISNVGEVALHILEAATENGCVVCALKNLSKGMTIFDLMQAEIAMKNGSVH